MLRSCGSELRMTQNVSGDDIYCTCTCILALVINTFLGQESYLACFTIVDSDQEKKGSFEGLIADNRLSVVLKP